MFRLFIKLNNWFVKKRNIKANPDEILLLTPHCLQLSSCNQNIIHNIETCKLCGKCNIADLLKIKNSESVHCSVAGGGRQAVRLAKNKKIKIIVAVACPKELMLGIISCFPKPVLAVCNETPNGPCKDTIVDVDILKSAINSILK